MDGIFENGFCARWISKTLKAFNTTIPSETIQKGIYIYKYVRRHDKITEERMAKDIAIESENGKSERKRGSDERM